MPRAFIVLLQPSEKSTAKAETILNPYIPYLLIDCGLSVMNMDRKLLRVYES